MSLLSMWTPRANSDTIAAFAAVGFLLVTPFFAAFLLTFALADDQVNTSRSSVVM